MDKDTLFSSFGKWVAPLNRKLISDWTLEFGDDRYVKKLHTLAYLLIFIDAQLQQHRGLRDIVADIQHHEGFHSELGMDSISTSQLSRKNNKVSPELLQQLFCDLVGQISKQSQPDCSRIGNVKLLDSTTVSLCLSKYKWAEYRKTKAGIKLHLRVAFCDPDTVYPEKAVLTSAKPADRTEMDSLIDETHVTYLFDRGYLDYAKFNPYSLDRIFFVTRLKDNAIIESLEEFNVPEHSLMTRDPMVKLGQGKKQTNMVFRLIETTDLKGKAIRILTNRFDLTAEEIGDLYRNRWKIETFFRWIKQHLKLTRFYGEQEHAVWNQIWICLIAYALLLLTKLELSTSKSLREVGRLLKVMRFRYWSEFREVVHRKLLRSSKGRQKVSKS
ncbi:IS4 family transposase [Paenibacillus sp. 23TSA30-6]|uniref:IS4 family transposase n=1 Tax=Paenibacillus sp. 23TSA30-6 TaxID=2546104 RepID=UPI001787D56F|nr:IS4 family transposase [Paenibacillus sp. 23TSA30-6]MBE0338705.1 IS4 family transposase [Paenibacillus sp. 23TSA30-6]